MPILKTKRDVLDFLRRDSGNRLYWHRTLSGEWPYWAQHKNGSNSHYVYMRAFEAAKNSSDVVEVADRVYMLRPASEEANPLNNKIRAQVAEAISAASIAVLKELAPETLDHAPESWNPESRKIFDVVTSFEIKARAAVDVVLQK